MTAAFVWASCRGDAQERRAEDNSEDQQPEFEAAQPEEHGG
jgi:hypothetical protein